MSTVSEIEVLFGAPTCAHRVHLSLNCAPGNVYMHAFLIFSYNNWLKKRAHTGCTLPKIVHPAVIMCAPGAPLILDTFTI